MVPLKQIPVFKKGELLTAASMNMLRDHIMRNRLTTGQSSGVTLQDTTDGTTIRVDPSAASGVFYAQSASVIAAATGTWPTLTCASITLDIYQRTGASLGKVDNAKVYNAMPDPTMANRRLILSLNPDGTYDVIGMSCHTG